MKHRAAASFPRIVAIFTATAQVLMPHVAHAASTNLTNVPLSVLNSVAPNLLFALDNSSSMALAYMPDEAMSSPGPGTYKNFARKNCFKNALFNKIYYDPAQIYRPAKGAEGNLLPNVDFYAAFPNAYDKTETFSDEGAGVYYGSPYFAYQSEGPLKSGPIDLSTSFQAVFDRGGLDQTTGYSHYDTKQPAYYYVYIGSTPSEDDKPACYDDGMYRKVVVSATSGPEGKDERTNFANWFSYYRTRMQTTKAALSRTFTNLNGRYRIGYSSINDTAGATNTNGDSFIAIDNFEGAHRELWYTRMFSTFPNGATPLAEGMRRAGEYFKIGKLPGAVLNYVDPIQQACQRNYLLVSTDGYANVAPRASIGNQDQVVPALPASITRDPVADASLKPGQPFPPPFNEGTTPSADSLADIAMYYWATNLRPAMGLLVPTTELDPATWQHMTTYAIGLGVSGGLSFTDNSYNKLATGTVQWPVPVLGKNTEIDDLWHAAVNGHGKYFSANNALSIEKALANSLAEIVGGVSSNASITVSNPNISATDNFAYSTTYESGRWSGDLKAFYINPNTGAVDISLPIWKSSAQAQLNARNWKTRNIATYSGTSGVAFTAAALPAAQRARLNTPTAPPGPGDHANVINFLRGDVSLEDIDYRARLHLLGDIVNADPVFVGPPSARYADAGYGAFRTRQASRPKMVYQGANDGMLHAFNAVTGAEQWAYVPGLLINEPYVFKEQLMNHPGTSALVNLSRQPGYTPVLDKNGAPVMAAPSFAKTQRTARAPERAVEASYPVIRSKQATQTGTAPALKAATVTGPGEHPRPPNSPATPAPDTSVPGASPVPAEPPANPPPSSVPVVQYEYQSGFTHRFYVDGTPVVADIDLAKTQGASGAPAWITLLVGGLNKGGRGYYALDVTDPGSVTSDATAASKVKWEFPNNTTAVTVAKNIGNSYGRPVTIKTVAAGWVTLVSSGYNNGVDTGGDGQGHLFVLNAANGRLIADLPTGAGTSATPSGLAQLSAYVQLGDTNSITDYVYGGDLLGNMWRFDLSSPTTAGWNVKRLATLVDAGGRGQPITTALELANVGAVRMVYVGTGQYLDVTDMPGAPGANAMATQSQTLYGLVDDLTPNPTIKQLRSSLVAQTLTVTGPKAVASANEVDLLSRKGWYIDLPNLGERSVSNPSVALGSVSFATNVPAIEVCGNGGSSWLYVLDYKNGGFINDPNVTWSGIFINKSQSNRPVLSRLKSGKLVQLVRTRDAKTVLIVPPVPPKIYKGRRTLWKEIITN